MALSGRDKGEVRALIDTAIGELARSGPEEGLSKDEELVRLQAYVYNLDAENRLLRLALYGQKERAAIARLAEHLGIKVDLDIHDDNEQRESHGQ